MPSASKMVSCASSSSIIKLSFMFELPTPRHFCCLSCRSFSGTEKILAAMYTNIDTAPLMYEKYLQRSIHCIHSLKLFT